MSPRYNGHIADSGIEASWFALCEVFDWTYQPHPDLGRVWRPDILAVTPSGPKILEVKYAGTTTDLAHDEHRITENMVGFPHPVILVGFPFITVTSGMCCPYEPDMATTAGMSSNNGACRHWKFVKFANSDVDLVPHCAPIPAAPDGFIIQAWATARQRAGIDGQAEPMSAPLPFEDDDETTVGE